MYRKLEELINSGESLKSTFTVVLSDGLKFTSDKERVGNWLTDCMNCLKQPDNEIDSDDEVTYKEFKKWIRKDETSSEITLHELEKLIGLLKEVDPQVFY